VSSLPAQEPKLRATLKGHTGSVVDMAFSPDSKTLASASYDGTLKLWDMSTGKERATLQGTQAVRSVAISPDGKILASVGGTFVNAPGELKVWDIVTEKTQVEKTKEYLAFERASKTKHEFLDGEVFAMSGASRSHHRISINISGSLLTQLNGTPCEPFMSDMRLRIFPTGLYTYPDVVVACENQEYDDRELDTLLTPTVVIEVLSPSTADYDRGTKWDHYRQIDSLQHYLLVSQDSMQIDMYTRNEDNSWRFTVHQPDSSVSIEAIGCQLNWAEIYARVSFEPESA